MVEARVSQAKKDTVAQLAKRLKEAKVVGLADMQDLPAGQLLTIRKALRGKVDMFMTKRRLMRVAIERAKKDIPGIEDLFANKCSMPALLFTSENPFSVYKTIKKSKSPAPAKAGQTAPFDITIPKGPTPFSPGPVISELSQLGIKAGVEGGKVAVKQDATVCREGEVINADVAGLLSRLGMTPMEVGLDLTAVLEAGTVYLKKVLDIDEAVFASDLMTAAQEAFNLAVEATYPTADTTIPIIQRAFREAKALGIEANILEKDIIEELLGKAERAALGVKAEAKLE